ncbi:MAG: response regulator RpfG family c-di-GMP phosphodiesterase [Bacteriovoracaceae bacterium]|jgi:response regulator RpfG family c-di-GMP phosphodiesterase
MIKKKEIVIEKLFESINSLEKEGKVDEAKEVLAKKILRYEGLIELGQLTSSSMDFKNIKKKAVGVLKRLLECEHVIIHLKDDKKNIMQYTPTGGAVLNEKYTYNIDDTTFVGSCAHHLAILHIDDVKYDIRSGRLTSYIKDLEPENMLLAPLVSKGKLLGVIQAINSTHGNFNEEDYHFVDAVSNQMTNVLENSLLVEELHNQFVQVISALADAIGKKDSYTGGHTKRVSHFADCIGSEMDLNTNEIRDLKMAAVLHDIGKIGIEDKILKKDSALNDEEFAIMKEHPRLGYEILGHIDSLSSVVDGMRFHHERPDGTGYPFGLKGDEIPVIAMIISVADTFDAMISTRPYRKGLPPMTAYDEIIKFRGTQFSEDVVDAFCRWFEKSSMFKGSNVEKNQKAS